MAYFDDIAKKPIKEHNPNWPQIFGNPYRILMTGCPGSGKTNALFNLINQHSDLDRNSLIG